MFTAAQLRRLAAGAVAAATTLIVPLHASAAAPASVARGVVPASAPGSVSLLAAGDNSYGELGTATNDSSPTALAVQVPGVVITHAAAGDYHSQWRSPRTARCSRGVAARTARWATA